MYKRQPGTLRMRDGAPLSPAFLAVATSPAPIPFLGGVAHTNPVDVIIPVTTGVEGGLLFPITWPPNAASGTAITFQVAVLDGANPFGVALSNGLRGTTF